MRHRPSRPANIRVTTVAVHLTSTAPSSSSHLTTPSISVVAGLVLRHDNGSQYASSCVKAKSTFLGIESSPAYLHQPEGNGMGERVIRTLKEQLLSVHQFAAVDEPERGRHAFNQPYSQQRLQARWPTLKGPRALLALESAAA